MHGTYEPEEILFNILERRNVIVTIKLVLLLCLRMHYAFMAMVQLLWGGHEIKLRIFILR